MTLAGLWIARGQAQRFQTMVRRLGDRGAFRERNGEAISAGRLTQIHEEMQLKGEQWAIVVGFLAAALIAGGFVLGNAIRATPQPRLDEFLGPVAGAAGGFFVGLVLGRMLSYSLLGRDLRERGVTFGVIRGHFDGAAGLKPLGDYYLFQAVLLAIPAVYLLAWSLLMAYADDDGRYASWREMYLILLVVAILIEIAGFVAPLVSAHRVMEREKAHQISLADSELEGQLREVWDELARDLTAERRALLRAQLEAMRERYSETETMPTWPVDRTLRRRVTIGNLALIVPLVSQLVELGS